MNELLSALLDKFDNPTRYMGVLLVGSGARGDLTRYSDIDLVFFIDDAAHRSNATHRSDAATGNITGCEVHNEEYQFRYHEEEYQVRYHEDRLISLTVRTIASAEEAFIDPEQAIARVAGLKNGVVLRDSTDSALQNLKARAETFMWTAELRQRAHRRASYHLMGNAEEVHKILRGFSEKDDAALLNGGWGITLKMPTIIALKKEILSLGDNAFSAQVREAVGIDSRWSRLYAMATGAYPGLPGCSQLALQAIAAFWLYDETAIAINDILLPEHRQVVDKARSIAKSSGLIPPADL